MKKTIFSAVLMLSAAVMSTSCGGGQTEEVNNDTVFTDELCDSLSYTMGAFMGVNLHDEIRNSPNADDFIEGYQLIAGHKYSYEKLLGMRAGIYIAEQFANIENQGVKINRNVFLQQFRKYIQDSQLDQAEYALLYKKFQDIVRQIDIIIQKRENMRALTAPAVDVYEITAEEMVETLNDTVAVQEQEITAFEQEMEQSAL